MGFTIYHGTSGLPSLGESLNDAGRNYLAGRSVVDQEKRTRALIDAGHQALAEREAEREAKGAYGNAQAELLNAPPGPSEYGGVDEPAWGDVGNTAIVPTKPKVHPKTGLMDYTDPAMVADRVEQLKALRKTFPQTPEGDAAYGMLVTEQGDLMQSHILDNKEAEAIDDIADSVAAMSMGEGMEPYVQSLQQIEQGYRATKGMSPKLREKAFGELERAKQEVVATAVKQQEKTRKITESVGYLDQQLGSTSPFDPNRAVYGQAKALIMAGADPEKVLEKVQTHVMGMVEVEPGHYMTKEAAEFELKRQREDRMAGKQQADTNLKYNELGAKRRDERQDVRMDRRKQRETERHNKAMEGAASQRISLSQERADALGKKGITIDAITRQMAVIGDTIPALTEKWGPEKLRDLAIENLEAMQERLGNAPQTGKPKATGVSDEDRAALKAEGYTDEQLKALEDG